MTCFAEWQPVYAAHGLATFPVRIEGGAKKPMARNYLRTGRPYSDRLAKQFPDASAFGFALGSRTRITVLDCDSSDERVLADAMTRHGRSPLIVRSGSGNYQAWYRHNGERRHIRPNPHLPVDILGGGFVVAPPSHGARAPYQIIAGALEDLDQLPQLQNFVAKPNVEAVAEGRRNNTLWEHLMRQARCCDDFTALLDVAETYNHSLASPLDHEEVVKTARSAWSITERGQNRFGQIGAFLTISETEALASDPYLLTLLAWLRAQNSPTSKFLIADTLADKFGWSLPKLRRCRKALQEMQICVCIRQPVRGCAALYRWSTSQSGNGLSISIGHAKAPRASKPKRCRGSVIEDSLSKSTGHCQTGVAATQEVA